MWHRAALLLVAHTTTRTGALTLAPRRRMVGGAAAAAAPLLAPDAGARGPGGLPRAAAGRGGEPARVPEPRPDERERALRPGLLLQVRQVGAVPRGRGHAAAR